MSKNNSNSSSSIGLPAIVFAIFLTLKLIGISPVADWSWWWVTCPLWAPAILVLVIFVIYMLLNIKDWI